jgi:hypothetical protein
VAHRHFVATGWLATALAAVAVLYFTWYRTLPAGGDEGAAE